MPRAQTTTTKVKLQSFNSNVASCKFTVEVLSEEALPQEIPILKDEICVRIGCSVRISGKTGKVEVMQAV